MRNSVRSIFPMLAAITFLLASFAFSGTAFASMTEDKALKIIQSLAPDAKIISYKSAPLGLTEVGFTSKGQTGILYLDKDGKYILMGALLDVATKKNITKDRFDELTRVNPSDIPLADAIVVGDPKAKNKIIVFSDPDCPYCTRLQGEIEKVVKQRKDIAFFIKLFPLKSIHPDSYRKSKAIACEKNNAKALKMLEDAYAKKDIPKPSCDTTVVDDNLALGTKYAISGTPTLIFPNGSRGSGMAAYDIIEQVDAKK